MTDDGARGLRISYWTGLISPESPLCYNNQNYQHIRLCSICYVYNREMRSWQFAESNFGLPAEDGFPSVFWLCFLFDFFFSASWAFIVVHSLVIENVQYVKVHAAGLITKLMCYPTTKMKTLGKCE